MEPRVIPPTVVIDNDETRTVRWTFEPGTTTGWHRHPLPYIVVPIIGGTLTFSDGTTSRAVTVVPGEATFRAAGIEHDVSNRSDATVVIVEVEVRTG